MAPPDVKLSTHLRVPNACVERVELCVCWCSHLWQADAVRSAQALASAEPSLSPRAQVTGAPCARVRGCSADLAELPLLNRDGDWVATGDANVYITPSTLPFPGSLTDAAWANSDLIYRCGSARDTWMHMQSASKQARPSARGVHLVAHAWLRRSGMLVYPMSLVSVMYLRQNLAQQGQAGARWLSCPLGDASRTRDAAPSRVARRRRLHTLSPLSCAGFLTRYLAQFLLSDEVAALMPAFGLAPLDSEVRSR